MKSFLSILFYFILISQFSWQDVYGQLIAPDDASADEFIDDLMKQMTLDEKIGQLNLLIPGGAVTGAVVSEGVNEKIKAGNAGGIFGIRGADKVRRVQDIAVKESRLKIPLIVGSDVIHGHETIFPIPLGLSCTWDMELIEKTAQQAAREATADGIMWNFSPMVDIARDPRWGRIAEGAGEDPYLGSEIAKAMVRGYQGEDLKHPETMLACVKHFACYGAAEGGRDYATADMSAIRLFNEYLPPYHAAVEAGVASAMTAFNVVDYMPATGSHHLFTEVLRDLWGFDGFVVTDYTAIHEMMHHAVGDSIGVTVSSLTAGVDMDMVSEAFVRFLPTAIERGLITEGDIDRACRRILMAKWRAGLFEDPYRYCDEERAKTEMMSESNRQFAREAAAQSCVLLKNDNDLLPLKKSGKIALIGPLADSRVNMLGMWAVSGDWEKAVTVKEAFEEALEDKAQLIYAQGAHITDDPELAKRINAFKEEVVFDQVGSEALLHQAVDVAKEADVIVFVGGEAANMSGEASSMAHIGLQPNQLTLLKELKTLGKPIVLLLFNGRPMTLKWESENVDAILDVWFGGTEGGRGIADVVFGDVNPSAKLTTSFPYSEGQIPVYHSMLPTGRPSGPDRPKFTSNYLDIPNEPIYPFGYGLSYTEFSYSNLRLSSDHITRGGSGITVSIDVTNTGARSGDEIVQLYIRDKIASISRPVKELKDFKKIHLNPGEKKTVEFVLTEDKLKFYNAELDLVSEPGDFDLFVGGNSVDLMSVMFTLE